MDVIPYSLFLELSLKYARFVALLLSPI
jgi:hypothetical protein